MTPVAPDDETIQHFLAILASSGFVGEVATDTATRTVFSTDNSVYEVRPRAILYPRTEDDLNRIMRAARTTTLPLTARGGGTGTNGQSLTDGIVVDCSRHLTQILAIDPVAGTAIVQPGVIRDQLNQVAGIHGLFFGPTCSTSSRATMAGMAATDASGKGSRVFGRTSDHILSMDVVLSDGSDWHAAPLSPEALAAVCARDDLPGRVHAQIRDVLTQEQAEIDRVFPVMNRGLTGYNLKEVRDEYGIFRLSKLLAGSEGTLAITKRLTLRLLRKKHVRGLIIMSYHDAVAAIRDAARLVEADPVAIEFLDDRILSLAQGDPLWSEIGALLSGDGDHLILGLNLIEVQADDLAELQLAMTRVADLGSPPPELHTIRQVTDCAEIDRIWSLRQKAVGLLGRMDPVKQGVPFVEDAAVPPAELADFVSGFRALLDGHGLAYGMFGHADVGCVHVRPALDMRQPSDAAQIRVISDAVAVLAKRHGGVLWGEHGKGYRGEYSPHFFGDRLFAALCGIKASFDPDDLLNPGKIATTNAAAPLTAIDAVPFRGTLDGRIRPDRLAGLEAAVRCNGNGACFNRAHDDVMCPSYKISGDRRQSPKGRAALLREWARVTSDVAQGRPDAEAAQADLEPHLLASLSTCLECKACSSQCPVKVDIPSMRSRFYGDYYRRHRRPARHYLLAGLEMVAPMLRRAPRLANIAQRTASPLLRSLGLIDLPMLRLAAPLSTSRDEPIAATRPVALVEDMVLGLFDGAVIEACEELLVSLGYHVERVAMVPSGKAAHVLGMDRLFGRYLRRARTKLDRYARTHHLVGIEPALLAMWQGEYAGLALPTVTPIDAFLASEITAGRINPSRGRPIHPLHLFRHCTERAVQPLSAGNWQTIFSHFGQALVMEETGCCGMAGMFGHEVEHQAASRGLFDQSWRAPLAAAGAGAMATGFSCRCQAHRLANARPDHPIETLARLLLA